MPDTLVVTSPHYHAYTAGNVDVSLLFGELEKNIDGVSVAPFSLDSAAAGAYDVIHVHWPEWVITRDRGTLAARRSARAVLSALTSARRRGTRLVWDANNVRPHEPICGEVTASFLRDFSQICDLLLVSNGSLADEFIDEYPALISTRRVHLGNMNYVGAYPSEGIDRRSARARLGLPPDKRIALAFGVVRRYKNLPSLMTTFRRFSLATSEKVHLVVAGNVTDIALRREIEEVAALAPDLFTLDLRSIPDELVAVYFRAADVVLIATSQSVKSGVSGLAMTLGTPVWMPRRGAAIDYADEVGRPALNLYEGGMTEGIMREAFSLVSPEPLPTPTALLDGRLGEPWRSYATRVLAAYRSLFE
ncbi:hypothetical protein AB0L74_29015 [Streptomyces sp. NPDC052020]|uniref:hypothetical protein n=1 Tax=Streptomyces sp. NPDC052020 TaxID=3155677 RepID=UPI0034248F5F